jgi:hypothetical protein
MFLTLSILHVLTNTNAAPLSTAIVNIAIQECLCPDQLELSSYYIFACSWVSVHHNIPGPDDSKVHGRLELMFGSIIVPEFITYCSAKQWSAARKLGKRYHSELHVDHTRLY